MSSSRCSRCRSVAYCGVACQTAHWPEHKALCGKQPAASAAPTSPAAPPSIAQHPLAASSLAGLSSALAALERDEPAGAPAGEAASPVPDLLAANPKLRALIALLRGEPIDCINDVATRPYVEGLLEGRRDQPWPPGKPHKFLVFTMHSESTRLVERACADLEIRACVLRGCRAQKDEAVRALHEDVDVMLVTAAKDCGGLNLPILSHIVFYHRVLDRNVEAQVAARGQRLGREGNLEVVTLVNEAEAVGLW